MKHPSQIAISDFTYDLPTEKIAVYPLEQRDESKLLIFKHDKISEDRFKNLDTILENDSLLVFNNTRVVRARLKFYNSKNQAIELFCLEPNDAKLEPSMAMLSKSSVRWNCLVGNLKRWKEDELRLIKDNLILTATISERTSTHVVINFSWKPEAFTFAEVLEQLGDLPIPPYLKRQSELSDTKRYQTIYAEHEGSVASPTAGLHFTENVFEKLREKSIRSVSVTLHVGAGTFKPVKSETMQDHNMHSEWIEINLSTIQILLKQKEKPIIAVGTTSLRTLETLYWMGVKASINPLATLNDLEINQWDVYDLPEHMSKEETLNALISWMHKQELEKLLCRTQILIAQPYQLKIAGGIITNFHQPQSTLLLLISAIVGKRWTDIYNYALQNDFRFLSYGDSSILLK